VLAAAAWTIAFATWSTEPAGYDFVAFYAAARLVATGHASSATDPAALLAMEHATLPERTILLPDANVPALALVMAPLGALPIRVAFAIWTGAGILALIGAALLLRPLAGEAQRLRLFPFALLAPTSLIALVEGQTTPFVLLALAGSLRVPPLASGVLLGLVAFRPQFLPVFAIVALADRRRAVGLIATIAVIGIVSFLTVGPEGMGHYPEQLAIAATELRPGELGLVPLVRRGLGGDDVVVNLSLAAIAAIVAIGAVLLRSRAFTTRAVDASIWCILAAPHALLHDGVMAYPAVARAATTTRATVIWAGSGMAVALVQQAGIPLAPFWLLALWWFSGRR
jgi:multidrug transporter EmrE-like cation transporter